MADDDTVACYLGDCHFGRNLSRSAGHSSLDRRLEQAERQNAEQTVSVAGLMALVSPLEAIGFPSLWPGKVASFVLAPGEHAPAPCLKITIIA